MDGDLVKGLGDVGAVGLMFLAYFVLHRETFKILQDMLHSMTSSFTNAIAEQKESTAATVKSVIDSYERLNAKQQLTDEQNHRVLCELTEDLKVLVASIGRIEMKVDNLGDKVESLEGQLPARRSK